MFWLRKTLIHQLGGLWLVEVRLWYLKSWTLARSADQTRWSGRLWRVLCWTTGWEAETQNASSGHRVQQQLRNQTKQLAASSTWSCSRWSAERLLILINHSGLQMATCDEDDEPEVDRRPLPVQRRQRRKTSCHTWSHADAWTVSQLTCPSCPHPESAQHPSCPHWSDVGEKLRPPDQMFAASEAMTSTSLEVAGHFFSCLF